MIPRQTMLFKKKKSLFRSAGHLERRELLARSKWRAFWVSELKRTMPSIPMVTEWKDSLLAKAFTGASGTLSRHVSGWKRFLEYCTAYEIPPEKCNSHNLVEFCSLFDPDEDVDGLELSQDGLPSLRSSLAALRWLRPKVQLNSWDEALDSPIVRGFAADARNKEIVKEAPPLTLRALACLETVLCNRSCPLGLQLVAGFFLVSSWASLRWADTQRIPPAWIHEDGDMIRGFTRQTKTSERGEAFAALVSGLTKQSECDGWGHRYKKALHKWLQLVPKDQRGDIDFLLPHVSPDGLTICPVPCDRFTAVRRLRAIFQACNVSGAEAYTSHSCKSTLLSWANQLQIPEFERLKQGTCEFLPSRAPCPSICRFQATTRPQPQLASTVVMTRCTRCIASNKSIRLS